MSLSSMLSKQFEAQVLKLGLMSESPVAVAVSGGGDSMALSLLAADYFRSVTFLSVDHGLRPEAKDEASQVKAWLKGRGQHVTLSHEGETPSDALQDWARQLRYRLMETWCRDEGVPALLLAHHQGDQAETVLMRLMRGSGVDGLAGMRGIAPPLMIPEGPNIYRPLLEFSKSDLLAYLKGENQSWIEDPSNKNERFKRIQARNWLQSLPDSENLIATFSETASRFGRVKDLLDSMVDKVMTTKVEISSYGTARFAQGDLKGLEEELGLRIVSRFVRGLGGNDYPARMEKLTRLYHALLADDFSASTLGGVQFLKTKDGISVFREVANCESHTPLIHGQSVYWDGRFLAKQESQSADTYHIGALEQKGWEQVLKQASEPKDIPLPHLARLSLPAIWLKDEVVAVPSIDFFKKDMLPIDLKFSPRNPLIKG